MIHHLILCYWPIFIIFVQIMIGVELFSCPSLLSGFSLYEMETIEPRTVGDCG